MNLERGNQLEQAPKKGMSQGCMVGLIIAGVVFLLVAASVITIIVFKEDIVRVTVVQSVIQIKERASENVDEAVDSDRFIAIADSFLERMKTDSTNFDTLWLFIGSIRPAIGDENLDSDELLIVEQAMMVLYPDLRLLHDTAMDSPDSTLMLKSDSAAVQD